MPRKALFGVLFILVLITSFSPILNYSSISMDQYNSDYSTINLSKKPIYTQEENFNGMVILTNGSLRVGIIGSPTSLNPLYYSLPDMHILELIFEKLVAPSFFEWYNPEKDIGWLALSVEREIISENLSVITVHLRQDAFWHDGTPFTADDVVFTYEFVKWANPPTTYPLRDLVINVTKIGDFTVKIYLNTASYVRAIMALDIFMLPRHIWGECNNLERGNGTELLWIFPGLECHAKHRESIQTTIFQ